MAWTLKSKSIRARPRKPKSKQQWQVKQPKRNWLELPSDVTANILHRIGPINMIENAQKVCTTWRNICKDPAMWRVIDMQNLGNLHEMRYNLEKMCMHAVDRSQGQLVEINIEYFGTIELLHYIADRSSQLRRLQLACLYGEVYEVFSEVVQKLPLLEELTLCLTNISKEDIEVTARCCPLLKTLKINSRGTRFRNMDSEDYGWLEYNEKALVYNEKAVAIGKSLPELRHLQLIGNSMSNIGLQAILDGCPHLESLDLRRCPNISLDGDLGKRCSEQIKCLRIPDDSLEDYKFDAGIYDSELSDSLEDYEFDAEIYDSELSYNSPYRFSDDYDGYYGYSDYDDFTRFDRGLRTSRPCSNKKILTHEW